MRNDSGSYRAVSAFSGYFRGFALAIPLLLASRFLSGQSLASIAGTVADPTGAVIPGAALTLRSTETQATRETVSDAAGRYTFQQVQPGKYVLDAKASGFSDVTVSNIELLVNTPTTLDVKFEKVGSVASSVTVESIAPQVNTTDASIGNAFGTKAITQLPFEARNVVGMLALQPGVTFIGADSTDPRNGSVNGGKSDQANVMLDGVDVNDQQNRYAFTSVLRVTLDSIQEFRVTATNANADQGRTSGAQVVLMTKSGTNNLHGSVYEYNRNTITTANTFFNNAARVPRPALIRNVYGASVGGPIKKNKLFFFLNYEGRRDASAQSTTATVPTASFLQGNLRYPGPNGSTVTLAPADIARLVDPLHVGDNASVLQLFQSYPAANDFTSGLGDGLNTAGYRFNSAIPLRQSTYIAKLDYMLNQSNSLFVRGNLQNDNAQGVQQFPGQPPASVSLNNSKGIAVGLDSMLRNNFVSTFRYGLTRQGVETTGASSADQLSFRGFTDRTAFTRDASRLIPVHQVSEDLALTHKAHDIRFGAVARFVRNKQFSYANSYNLIQSNPSWLVGNGTDLDANISVPASFVTAFNQAASAMLGLIDYGTARYNYTISGTVVPHGSPVVRDFANNEYEMYAMDSWHVTRGLTITAGLRYSLMPPVYEVNGNQVSPIPSLSSFFEQRAYDAENGLPQTSVPLVQYYPVNSPQGHSLYPFHKDDFAPRLAIAYSPQTDSGWKRRLFGGPGRTSIRAGFGMFYDLFGQSIMASSSSTALGVSTAITNPSGVLTASTSPRFTGLSTLPAQLLAAAPPVGFPQTAPQNFSITTGVDGNLRAPYTMNLDFSIGRELPHDFLFQVSYVGRLARRTLTAVDMSQPTNLVDPASGMTFYQAATILSTQAVAKAPVSQIQPVAFWQNLWPGAAGNGLTATQGIYQLYLSRTTQSWMNTEQQLDVLCTPSCSKFGPYAMFNSQYSSLGVLRSIGMGSYNAMQITIRKRFSAGVQFDVNYTWGKSEDLGSTPERSGAFSGFIPSSWFPGQAKGVSDYDTTQSINTNWVVELPFGKDKPILGHANKFLNGIIGGWQLTGLYRMTSGFPVSVVNGLVWPTDWNITGWATQIGSAPASGVYRGGGAPNLFGNPQAALGAYTYTAPGGTGQRNGIRGDGLFDIDMGLGKRFQMPYKESHSLQIRWEVFNVTNTARFDPASASLTLTSPTTFGAYTNTLGSPRVMQFGARYEF